MQHSHVVILRHKTKHSGIVYSAVYTPILISGSVVAAADITEMAIAEFEVQVYGADKFVEITVMLSLR